MNENKSRIGAIILGIVLGIILGSLATYAITTILKTPERTNCIDETKIKETKKEEKENEKETETKDVKQEEKVKGECPLYIFTDNYQLTEQDKDEIISAMKKENINVDRQTLELGYASDYYLSVRFDTEDHAGSPLTAILFKVNGEYKCENYGNFTKDYVDQLKRTLNKICS